MAFNHMCPSCNSELRRTWRRPVDRFASLFLPLHRYRCCNFSCRWKPSVSWAGKPAAMEENHVASTNLVPSAHGQEIPVGPRRSPGYQASLNT